VTGPGPVAALDELLARPVSMRALALLRVLVGPVVLLHLRPFLADAVGGRIYRDTFHEPYAAWYPEFPRALYVGLLWAGAAAAVAMTVGLATRVATAATAAIVAYNLFLSTTHVHNNRAYLVIVLGVLALAPSGRELSLDAWLRRRRGLPPLPRTAPGWPLWLLRVEASVVYGASGLSKLVDPDWFGGTVTWHRVVRVRDRLAESPLPDWTITVLTDRSFHTYAAKVIVLTEVFIALGLWWRGTRYLAVWVAVWFHVFIQVTARVEVFSYLAIAALVIWAVPSTRDRVLVVDPGRPWPRRLAAAVERLDWLARFRVEHGPPGAPVAVVDRDGRALTGGGAVALALSRLPLTAWPALPATGWRAARSGAPPRVTAGGPATSGAALVGTGRAAAGPAGAGDRTTDAATTGSETS
jgi:hypothetical protein